MNFNERCYEVLRKVPQGKVTTYAELAKAIGCLRGARAVGNVMKKNPHAPEVPCHRVVKSNGEVGGFVSGTENKIAILEKEGITIINGKIDLRVYLHQF